MRRLTFPLSTLLVAVLLNPIFLFAEDNPAEKSADTEPAWVAEIERNPLLPPPVHAAADEKDRHLLNELNQPSLAELLEIPFSESLQLLGDVHDVHIHLQHRNLEELGLDARTPIALTLPGETSISMRSTLHHQLRLLSPEVTWNIVDGDIVVSTYESNHEFSQVRVYPLSSLLLDSPEEYRFEAGPEKRLDSLVQIVKTASSGWWVDTDGEGGQARPLKMSSGHGIAVRQTRPAQQEVAVLLTALESIEASHREGAAEATLSQHPFCGYAMNVERLLRKAEFRMRDKLRTEVEADFIEVSLQEVVDFYSDFFQLPIRIDHPAMDDEGIPNDAEVTYFGNQELRYVLDGILSQIDCDYYFDHEMLVIAPAYRCDEMMSTCVYDVTDLIAANELAPVPNPADPDSVVEEENRNPQPQGTGGGGAGFFDMGSPVISLEPASLSVDPPAQRTHASPLKNENSLVDAILHTTSGEWETIGGYGGTVQFYETANARMLIVHQNRRTQEEIAELLESMRQLKGE
ncbi:hypothetical protein [Rubinisphaera margarita]|uniref:hypothetical protein n=1 Tax=Rubinisphaera margarita TaxID=2909586 RepID=UPI001EE7D6E1|nr:hypothetical protein [Rubinisphaera margarita]MCG6155108.1 hypothetical protein [Rubinisphaera margarita]